MYLTPKELAYLSDTDFLLTKRQVQQKINHLLVQTEATLKEYIQKQSLTFPEGVLYKAGKISQGENYRGLPYQVLDYPRLFHKEDIFALRTMCWWGHTFSVTLHLQGRSWKLYQPVLLDHQGQLFGRDLFLCVHPHPWEYHQEEDNYQAIDQLTATEVNRLLSEKHFLKLTAFLPLGEGDRLPAFALHFFTFILHKCLDTLRNSSF